VLKQTRLLAVIGALMPAASLAQDPTSTDGDKYKVIFENDCVRVLDYKDKPGERTVQHRHPAFVLYSLSSFSRTIMLPDGKTLKRQFNPGDVMWSDAQTHIGINSGDTPTHVILVETKPAIGACASK
jgi:beta-alanine degradation protein BauB